MTDKEEHKINQYIKPGAVVPVDMQTTALLVNALRAALAQPEPDYRDVVTKGDLWRIEFLPNHAASVVLVRANYEAQPEKTDMQIGLTYEEANPHVHANDISKERVHKTQKNEHEPVAWRFHDKNMWCYVDHLTNLPQDKFEPLYTEPQKKEWVGLTEADKKGIFNACEPDERSYVIAMTEALLKDKNK